MSLQGKHFPIHLDEARSVGLAKACVIFKNIFCSRENQIESDNLNRMRNLHAFIKQEFGEESVLKLRLWEKAEKKMADYKNHRRFTIKCLKRDIIPVSIKLRTSLLTKKASQIIKRAERQLLNERIRNINNTIEINMFKRDAYFQYLENELDPTTLQECQKFIDKVRECRHKRVQERQIKKFNTLEQKRSGRSNQDVREKQ